MSEERLRTAITTQAEDMKRRIEWLQKMMDRQAQISLNCQEMIGHYRTDLQAANMALDGLRAEYRKLIENNGSKEQT